MRNFQLLLAGIFIVSVLILIPSISISQNNNIQWDWLYHNDPDNYNPTTEFVPFETFTFRDVDPSGKVYPSTNVNIYIMVDWGDLTSANVVYSTGGSDTWVSMSWVKNITCSFHEKASRTYDLWVGTIPAQAAGTTVWYRIQVNDGSANAYLKSGNSAGGAYHNPLGQWVRNPDVSASDNYSYQVEQPIPVELTAFTATVSNGAVILNWTTQTETENYGFHVYRSQFEDRDYVKITQSIIPGAGTSEVIHEYSYTDATADPSKTYYYKLAALDYNGNVDYHGPISINATKILSNKNSSTPGDYFLEQNYPNPFNPETTIRFTIKKNGLVTLEIHDLQGRLIKTLAKDAFSVGNYSVTWDGTDEQGNPLASNIYLCTLKVDDFTQTNKLIFIK